MRWLSLMVLITLPQFCIAQEVSYQFEQANQFYRNGNFQNALAMYEQIVTNGYESSVLHYNLGNAYFKLQNIPAAILQYERARILAPHDEDVSYNLHLANLRVIDKIEPIPKLFFIEWWRAFVDMFSSDGWAMIGVINLWLAAFGGATYLFIRTIVLQRLAFFLSFLSVLLCILAFTGTFQRIHREQNEQNGIVFSASVSVKSSPDAQSTDLFVLHDGVKVELLDTIGEWKKIRLADGKVGWIPVESLQVI